MNTVMRTIQEDFDAKCAASRRWYWQGVRDAQKDTERHQIPVAYLWNYRLGHLHVQLGVVLRTPLAKIHHGPEFIEDTNDFDLDKLGRRVREYQAR